MSAYHLLLFVHLAGVVAWVGGALAVTMMTTRLIARGDAAVLTSMLRELRFVGATVMGTGAVLTLVGGFGLMGVQHLPPTLWIVYGLISVVLSFLLGGTVLRRSGDRLFEAPGDRAAGRRFVIGNWVVVVLLFTVIAAMVFKPTL